MQTTTTPNEPLEQALQDAGLTPRRAARVTNLLYPAGQHWLLTHLQANPDFTLTSLLAMFRDDLADLLRASTATTEVALKAFRTAVTA